MGLIDNARSWWAGLDQPRGIRRADYPLTFDQWLGQMSLRFNGMTYPVGGLNQSLPGSKRETVGQGFSQLVVGAYAANGTVFACELARFSAFSEVRFGFRDFADGRPGDLIAGTDQRNPGFRDLKLLGRPWPGATTGDLLSRVLLDADFAGNAFLVRRQGPKIKRLRPDWVVIVCGSEQDPEVDGYDIDAEVIGYAYLPGGPSSGEDPVPLLASEVAHFAPVPDPLASYRGMSWLTPVIRQIEADQQMTEHKSSYLSNAATPNLIVRVSPDVKTDEKLAWIKKIYREEHEGPTNAYKTLFLAGGADATVVGSNFQELDFAATQRAGETIICAAAGVPPVVVGLGDAATAGSYSIQNYQGSIRRYADMTIRPLWRNLCGSLETIVSVPAGFELWYDDRDVAFLREDAKDRAGILFQNAQAIRQLTDAGFIPKAAVDAVTSGELERLEHSNLFSVQLHPPGTKFTPDKPEQLQLPEPAPNGNQPQEAPA